MMVVGVCSLMCTRAFWSAVECERVHAWLLAELITRNYAHVR